MLEHFAERIGPRSPRVWAADIVREVEEARRMERAQRAAQAAEAVTDRR